MIDTYYPFSGNVVIQVSVDQPAAFPLRLRIPGWAEGVQVRVGTQTWQPEPGSFFLLERTWEGGERVN